MDLTDEMLLCRDSSMRHQWDLVGDEEFIRYRGQLIQITRVFRCDRGCGCRKREVLSVPDFTRLESPVIEYPYGYNVRGGGVTNEDVRREYYLRRGVMRGKQSALITGQGEKANEERLELAAARKQARDEAKQSVKSARSQSRKRSKKPES
jgi:hypothetical protein